MAYIFGLILVLGIIFSATTGNNFIGNIWDNTSSKFNEFAFPKSQKEIVIENLNSQYKSLDGFFSGAALDLLQNKNVSPEDKKKIQKAIQSFGSSKDLVSQIENLTKNDKSLTKALIEKVFDLDSDQNPEPTHIPPNCNLVCKE